MKGIIGYLQWIEFEFNWIVGDLTQAAHHMLSRQAQKNIYHEPYEEWIKI